MTDLVQNSVHWEQVFLFNFAKLHCTGEADNPMDPEKGMNGFQFNEAEGTYYNHDIGCIYDPKQQRYRDANSGRWFKYVDGGYREVSP